MSGSGNSFELQNKRRRLDHHKPSVEEMAYNEAVVLRKPGRQYDLPVLPDNYTTFNLEILESGAGLTHYLARLFLTYSRAFIGVVNGSKDQELLSLNAIQRALTQSRKFLDSDKLLITLKNVGNKIIATMFDSNQSTASDWEEISNDKIKVGAAVYNMVANIVVSVINNFDDALSNTLKAECPNTMLKASEYFIARMCAEKQKITSEAVAGPDKEFPDVFHKTYEDPHAKAHELTGVLEYSLLPVPAASAVAPGEDVDVSIREKNTIKRFTRELVRYLNCELYALSGNRGKFSAIEQESLDKINQFENINEYVIRCALNKVIDLVLDVMFSDENAGRYSQLYLEEFEAVLNKIGELIEQVNKQATGTAITKETIQQSARDSLYRQLFLEFDDRQLEAVRKTISLDQKIPALIETIKLSNGECEMDKDIKICCYNLLSLRIDWICYAQEIYSTKELLSLIDNRAVSSDLLEQYNTSTSSVANAGDSHWGAGSSAVLSAPVAADLGSVSPGKNSAVSPRGSS